MCDTLRVLTCAFLSWCLRASCCWCKFSSWCANSWFSVANRWAAWRASSTSAAKISCGCIQKDITNDSLLPGEERRFDSNGKREENLCKIKFSLLGGNKLKSWSRDQSTTTCALFSWSRSASRSCCDIRNSIANSWFLAASWSVACRASSDCLSSRSWGEYRQASIVPRSRTIGIAWHPLASPWRY